MARARFSLALALLAAFLAQQSVAQGVEFHDLAFDQAVERAAAENKLVFVDFFTTWCAPCKEMDATTFQDPEVADWLAEHTGVEGGCGGERDERDTGEAVRGPIVPQLRVHSPGREADGPHRREAFTRGVHCRWRKCATWRECRRPRS